VVEHIGQRDPRHDRERGPVRVNPAHFAVPGSRVASVRVSCRSGLGRRD
jgi:hypothetical protein